jgi:hypothetical protein
MPINTPKAELEALPVGTVVRAGAGYWQKTDDGELITRREAREQVQRTLDAFSNDLMRELERKRHEEKQIEDAVIREDADRRIIFASLLFVGDASWATGLEILRTRYNKVAANALDLARMYKQRWSRHELEIDAQIEAGLVHLENLLLRNSSEINEAIRKAIGEGDKGAALKQLSERVDLSIIESLRELLGNIKTENLATDRSFNRALVWIGWNCNILEDRKGMKDIEAMWKTLHKRLQVNRESLTGDKLDAWHWFEQRRPYDMLPDERRRFNQEVSRFKTTMKPYYDERRTSDRSPDKE